MNDLDKFLDGIGAIAEIMSIMYATLIKHGASPGAAATMAEDMAKWLIERK